MNDHLQAYLADLAKRGVLLGLAPDGNLRVKAPREVLTPADREMLGQHKDALLAILDQQQTDADLALVLSLVEQTIALVPDWCAPGILADLSRGYHQRGERQMLRDAIGTAMRLLENLQSRPRPAGTLDVPAAPATPPQQPAPPAAKPVAPPACLNEDEAALFRRAEREGVLTLPPWLPVASKLPALWWEHCEKTGRPCQEHKQTCEEACREEERAAWLARGGKVVAR